MGSASSTSIFWNGLTDTYLARANAIGSYSSSNLLGTTNTLVINEDWTDAKNEENTPLR